MAMSAKLKYTVIALSSFILGILAVYFFTPHYQLVNSGQGIAYRLNTYTGEVIMVLGNRTLKVDFQPSWWDKLWEPAKPVVFDPSKVKPVERPSANDYLKQGNGKDKSNPFAVKPWDVVPPDDLPPKDKFDPSTARPLHENK